MARISQMRAMVLDCPDPRAPADFYRQLVGGEIPYANDDWVNLREGRDWLVHLDPAGHPFCLCWD